MQMFLLKYVVLKLLVSIRMIHDTIWLRPHVILLFRNNLQLLLAHMTDFGVV